MPTPQEIHSVLQQMHTTADQDKYLLSLDIPSLQQYADWSAQNVPAGPKPDTNPTKVNGFNVQHGGVVNAPSEGLSDEELNGLSDEDLDGLSSGKLTTTDLDNKSGIRKFAETTGRGFIKGGLSLASPLIAIGDGNSNEIGDALSDDFGLHRPASPGESVVEDVAGVIPQVWGLKGLGSGLSAVGEKFADRLLGKFVGGAGKLLQADRTLKVAKIPLSEASVGAATGTAAGDIVRNNGGDTKDQIVASLVAGGIPGGFKSVKDYGVRKLFGAGTAEGKANIAKALADFQVAGITPSVGEATLNPNARGTEAFLSRLFGTSGIMQRSQQAKDAAIGSKILGDAERLSPGANPTEAGLAIRNGIEGYSDTALAREMGLPEDHLFGWKPRQDRMGANLWNQFGREVNPAYMVDASPIKGFLDKEIAPVANDPGGVAGLLKPGKSELQQMREAFLETMGSNPRTVPGEPVPIKMKDPHTGKMVDSGKTRPSRVEIPRGVPFEALQRFRTNIGQQVESALLNGSPEAGAWRKLYGLTTEAMKGALDSMDKVQGLSARKAWEKASQFTRDYHDQLEIIGKIASKEGGFENIYQAAVGGTSAVPGAMQLGGSRVYNVMKELDKPQRQLFAAAILKRLGGPSQEFDLSKWVTNYDKMDTDAREAVFQFVPKSMRKDYETVVRVGRNLLEGRKEFGVTTQAREGGAGRTFFLYPLLALSSGLIGATTGNAAGLKGVGSVVGGTGMALLGSRALAKKMIDPTFVRWLAKSTELPKSQIPAAIAELGEIARQHNDPDLQTLVDFYQQQEQ